LICGYRPAANLGISIAGGLSLCGGVGFGNLTLFASCCGFGDGGGFGPASCFDSFCGCRSRCFFGLSQSAAHGGVGVFCLVSEGCLSCVTGGGLCCCGCGFGFGLGEERLLTNLLGGTMSQLSAVLPARCRKVAILCSMKIGPGVKDGHIFRGVFCVCLVIDSVRATRIHKSASYTFQQQRLSFEPRRFAASSNDDFAPVVMQ
jgi:hypothetical protein